MKPEGNIQRNPLEEEQSIFIKKSSENIVGQKEEDVQRISLLQKAISKIFILYIETVARTSRITVNGDVDYYKLRNSIIGFWHGESFGLNLLMREIQDEGRKMKVVVTRDSRGNYIEEMLKNYGIGALRMPDGIRMKSFLRKLKAEGSQENNTVGIALDGPLGPYREPKKIAFMLSNEGNKPCILVKGEYSRKITLKKRWDNYIIPLPFSKANFTLVNYGIVEKKELKEFNKIKARVNEII